MALYKFRVTDASNEISEQLVEADSQREAVRRLQRRKLKPVTFLGDGTTARSRGKALFGFRTKFDIVDFTDRLVPLLEAHVPLENALGVLAEHMDDKSRPIVESLRKGLHEGRRLSQMLRDRSAVFPPLYVSLVEVGEEAGALEKVMADLRDFLVEKREMQAHIISVSIYPAIVFTVSTLILGIMFGVIIPRFAGILDVAGGDTQGSMRMLMAVSMAVRSYWWAGLLGLAVLSTVFMYLTRQPVCRRQLDELILKIPLLKQIVYRANLARMTRTMSILMRSGVHILDTVKISSRVLQNQAIRESVTNVPASLRKGRHLADALADSRHIPPDMVRMLAIGEETGELESMLEKLGRRYERDLKNTMQRALSILEPALILSLGLVIAVVVVTMFMAILEIQGTL